MVQNAGHLLTKWNRCFSDPSTPESLKHVPFVFHHVFVFSLHRQPVKLCLSVAVWVFVPRFALAGVATRFKTNTNLGHTLSNIRRKHGVTLPDTISHLMSRNIATFVEKMSSCFEKIFYRFFRKIVKKRSKTNLAQSRVVTFAIGQQKWTKRKHCQSLPDTAFARILSMSTAEKNSSIFKFSYCRACTSNQVTAF